MLTHHLGLGVAVAGVEAVGPAGHCGRHVDWRMAEDLPLVSLSYPGTQTPRHARPLAPLAGLALVVEALARALPDTPETQHQVRPVLFSERSEI